MCQVQYWCKPLSYSLLGKPTIPLVTQDGIYHVYITCSTYNYAHALPTQVNCKQATRKEKKRNQQRTEKEANKKRKESKRNDKKDKNIQDKKRKQGKEKRKKNIILADPRN